MKNERGFTLIEVVIAIAWLGIVAVLVLGWVSNSSRAMFIADERTTAESLARGQIEYVKSWPWSDNADYGTYGTVSLSGVVPDPSNWRVYGWSDNLTQFAKNWNIDSQSVSANVTGIQKIMVSVKHFNNAKLPTLQLDLEGYKGKR